MLFNVFKGCTAILTTALLLSGCGEDYPLVANGYAKTADISALDDQGRGNFAQPIPPKSCLLAFKAMPDLATLQIRIYIENEVDKTYDKAALKTALSGADFSKGILVASASGLRFEKGYECDEEIR